MIRSIRETADQLIVQKSAPSRIILVSSLGHKFAKMDWNNLGHEQNYNAMTSYGNSKLANILHGVELSKRLEGLCAETNVIDKSVRLSDLFLF